MYLYLSCMIVTVSQDESVEYPNRMNTEAFTGEQLQSSARNDLAQKKLYQSCSVMHVSLWLCR